MVLATERGLAERAWSGGVGYERAPAELIDELTGPETNWVCGARNWTTISLKTRERALYVGGRKV